MHAFIQWTVAFNGGHYAYIAKMDDDVAVNPYMVCNLCHNWKVTGMQP